MFKQFGIRLDLLRVAFCCLCQGLGRMAVRWRSFGRTATVILFYSDFAKQTIVNHTKTYWTVVNHSISCQSPLPAMSEALFLVVFLVFRGPMVAWLFLFFARHLVKGRRCQWRHIEKNGRICDEKNVKRKICQGKPTKRTRWQEQWVKRGKAHKGTNMSKDRCQKKEMPMTRNRYDSRCSSSEGLPQSYAMSCVYCKWRCQHSLWLYDYIPAK